MAAIAEQRKKTARRTRTKIQTSNTIIKLKYKQDMKKIILILGFFLAVNSIYGQDIFKKYGLKEPLTLSKGRYVETFPNKEIVQIGTVMLNTKTNKVVEFLDEDTTAYAYEAEFSSRWLSPDPLAKKYPELSPYVYCANNPINVIDPDGREGIVVSGSPGEHDNKLHFLINGLDRAKAAQGRAEKGEGTTWLIYNDKDKGFNQKDLDKYTADAQKAGINVEVVSEVSEIVDYVNNKTGEDSRSNDQISSFYYVGHSTPGDLDVGYAGSGQNFDPSDFKSNAFKSGAWVNVVGGCRTAIDDKLWGILTIDKSIIKQFADILDNKSTINGSNVRVVYSGGVARDQKLLEPNKGKIITIHGNRKK
jgi:hypothetical protein